MRRIAWLTCFVVVLAMAYVPSVMAKESAPLDLDTKNAALLILHYQNDIVHPKGKIASSYAQRISDAGNVTHTKAVLNACRQKGVPVIHVRFALRPGAPEVSQKPGPLFSAFTKAGVLVDGTWGAEIIDELKPIDGEPVVSHASKNGFWGTDLDIILHSMGVTDVMMAGIATARYVVLATTLAASDRQYYPIVLQDCCNDASDELHDWIIDNVLSYIAIISDSKEVVEKINTSK
ncbi:isochorismatase [Desulfosarcina widdelii]|uniref:Isochorismatase n=1 Tax=Desulfosarcina widdelii TaxID=947919 RepID=A0A5K7Z9P7_9BACT|nr:isochorismatase family cysteine hydrolase [Desulfosarcina widdelii]BBO78576.1 isochorismatase [Desulfosarcina widdelii]